MDFSNMQPATSDWTSAQRCWILRTTLLATCLCFGFAFGFASLTFAGKPNPTMYGWPTPIWGSLAVTIGLQTTLNWLVTTRVITLAVLDGSVAPRRITAGSNSFFRQYRWWFNINGMVVYSPRDGESSFWKRFGMHMLRETPWLVLSFSIIWPLFFVVCLQVWGLTDYNSFPLPSLLLGSAGAMNVVLTLPLWCAATLLNASEWGRDKNAAANDRDDDDDDGLTEPLHDANSILKRETIGEDGKSFASSV